MAAVKKVLEDKSLRCVPYNLGTGTGEAGEGGCLTCGPSYCSCGLGLQGWPVGTGAKPSKH